MLLAIIYILVIYSPIETVYSSPLLSPDLRIKYAGQALNALQRLLNFFEIDANNTNLDGIYCLRVAQGQLNTLHQMITSSTNKQIHLTDKNNIIRTLSIQIDRIANVSLNVIARVDSSYLQRFAFLVTRPFIIESQSKTINQSLIENEQEKDPYFDADQSDLCFGELLGSNGRPNSTKCSISELCWNRITSRMSKDYRLTHHLLWYLIAKDIGCLDTQTSSSTTNIASVNYDYFINYFCANIYEDAKFNFLNNINQDLFLEQLLLCSIIGYEQFLRVDWLTTILTWQHLEYGCFGNASETISLHRQHKRHLLVEQIMSNGCLSHKSGLAAGLLATYARFFLQ